ncbi:MAG TPA: dihydroorotase [Balneolales bacterium]|nr:dihydroorotase [Balneolales bacterium]
MKNETPDLLFKNVKIATSEKVGDVPVDIRIKDGKIDEISEKLEAVKNEKVHDYDGAYVSPGWMDMHVHFREPGYEHKETIVTGASAAAFGGFTAVACMPNTNPPIHTRDVVEFIINKSRSLPVDVHPIACVSKERKGKSITEMADLKEGGAVAFSDDGDPVSNSWLMRIALEYSSMLDRPVINHEEDLNLSRPGHMNEGKVSARLGIDGTPGIAEEVMIARDIMLAELTGGHIHIAHISTAKGVELVRQAKVRGVRVTTEVCAHHIDMTDEEIEKQDFDTNFKMHPPLRTEEDRQAVIDGLKDGTIDAYCTDHAPHAIEEKDVEFIYAPNGIIGLETAWPIAVKRLYQSKEMPLNEILAKLIDNPRKILHLDIPKIEVGAEANLTFFNVDERWRFDTKHIHSKSKNTPYVGSEMIGRALGIYNKGHWVVNKI